MEGRSEGGRTWEIFEDDGRWRVSIVRKSIVQLLRARVFLIPLVRAGGSNFLVWSVERNGKSYLRLSICPCTLEKSKIRFLKKKKGGCTDVFYRRKGWKELPWKIHPEHSAQSQTLDKKEKKKEKRLVEEQRLAIIASFSFNECSSTARTSVIGLFSVVGTRWKRYRP